MHRIQRRIRYSATYQSEARYVRLSTHSELAALKEALQRRGIAQRSWIRLYPGRTVGDDGGWGIRLLDIEHYQRRTNRFPHG